MPGSAATCDPYRETLSLEALTARPVERLPEFADGTVDHIKKIRSGWVAVMDAFVNDNPV